MLLTDTTIAVMAVTATLDESNEQQLFPLLPKEWGRFLTRLNQIGISPAELDETNLPDVFQGWTDRAITEGRIASLLARKDKVVQSATQWNQTGIWILTCFDQGYPPLLKQRLGCDAPAILYGTGDVRLAGQGGLAIVGSRKPPQESLDYAYQLGSLAAQNKTAVISGGAQGIDETSMKGAVENGGVAVSILSDNLLVISTSKNSQRLLAGGQLVLLSPFAPESAFSIGQAMGRNKYIYCLATAGFVVHSGISGGTWSGARENLKHGWTALWVADDDSAECGNSQLVQQGGIRASAAPDELSFNKLISQSPKSGTIPGTDSPSLF